MIDPPYDGNEYVTVCVTPAFGNAVRPEAMVFPATETGACALNSLVRQPGTHVLHTQADTDQQFADACAAALLILGQPGYVVEAS
ncbi:hypothetical protein [Nocardia nova]|uniref:hypothetical protein n=1 Tax=Nocardia nova TaxID=37330 RepID=UPI0027399E13|nr:hypothetical protein [Nocardia nova]